MSAQVAVVGSYIQDLAFRVEQFPRPGETRIGHVSCGAGGKGSNQAVACHRQGVATVFVGAVGDDLFGVGFREWSTREGLETSLISLPGRATGVASILVNEAAENQIVVALGANEQLPVGHVVAALSKNPALKVLLCQAESSLPASYAAMQTARKQGVFALFNPAPINTAISRELVAEADCITPNETEFAFLLQHLASRGCGAVLAELSDDEIREACELLPCPSVLLTLGAAGSLYYQRRAPHRFLVGVRQGDIIRTPAIKVTACDTTGAGDAFNGGLAAGLVKFFGDIRRAIRYATVVAGLSTEREGAASAMPRAAEVGSHARFFDP